MLSTTSNQLFQSHWLVATHSSLNFSFKIKKIKFVNVGENNETKKLVMTFREKLKNNAYFFK